MPYWEKKIYSGRILEVEIYPITLQERKQSRRQKEKISEPKQKNLNDKNAKKHLIRLLNTNFSDNDLHITLTYKDDALPKDEEDAKKDVNNYLRRIKRFLKKNELPELKYIAVIEYREGKNGKKVRMHHHIVISGDVGRDNAEKLWKKGRANADRLQADEFGYEALARYISKDPQGKKRWTQSRNLKQPTIRVSDYKYSNRKVNQLATNQGDKTEFEKLYPGYIYTSYEVQINEVTAGTYIYLKMRKEDG